MTEIEKLIAELMERAGDIHRDDIAKLLRFCKKPVKVEAFRLGEEYPDWFADAVSAEKVSLHNRDNRWRGGPDYALIKTLEGVMCADHGDWIIKGVKGELYPCKPDIFAMTYEPAALLDAPEVGEGENISTAPKPDTLGQPTFAACTGHPDCKGPSLVEDHDAVCPFDGGDDCDNETCHRGCEHCTTEGALI